ncbi:MAG: hypothetical protein SFZ03_04495 [Candidatus Melainabacteria bacterium]|nr:hypothetical protein [Candidatus Melainabacteria bacterium]
MSANSATESTSDALGAPPANLDSSAPAPATKSYPLMNSQVKMMGILTLAFFTGMALYTFLPEGAVRGSAIGIYSVVVMFVLMRWGA